MTQTPEEGFQRFLAKTATHRLLSPHEEKALARRVHTGDMRARDELVLCNVRLVVSIARYYRNRGMGMEDVIQEGIIGLNRAAEKFDPRRNIRFSTYATLWIRQSIQRALLGRASTIQLPSAVAGNRAKLQSAAMRNPGADIEALAKEMEITPAEAERALEAAEVVTSLDREVMTDNSVHTLLDSMADPHAEHPHDLIRENTSPLHAALPMLEHELSRNHRQVIEMRFGIDREPLLIKEISAALSMSDNTVKTLQNEALQWLAKTLAVEMGRDTRATC